MMLFELLRNILRRIDKLEHVVMSMGTSLENLQAAEATLETVVAHVTAEHNAMASALEAAKAANDWSGVDAVAAKINAQIDALNSLVPAPKLPEPPAGTIADPALPKDASTGA